jgi:hypothetical protein
VKGPKYLVYGLIDPRTRLIMYIGKSSSGMDRVRRHRSDALPHRRCSNHAWLVELKDLGLAYEIVILESADSPNQTPTRCWWSRPNSTALNDSERWWIAYGRACGWPLTNIYEGGNGRTVGYKASPETRAKMAASHKGKKHSDESRAKIADAARAQGARRRSRLSEFQLIDRR